MPLGRKHLRRSRDAPTGGIGHGQRATSRLGTAQIEVNYSMQRGKAKVQAAAHAFDSLPLGGRNLAVPPSLFRGRVGSPEEPL
jgi:hypothetical protein